VSFAAVPVLALAVTVSSQASATGHSPAATHVSAAALAAARAAIERDFTADTGPAAAGSRLQHRDGPAAVVASAFWAGYVAKNTGGDVYTQVTGNWIQPAIKCNPNETELAVFWVGLDGYTSTPVEQTGSLAECFKGAISYYTWWQMFPDAPTIVGATVKAGDNITATVTFAGGNFNLTVNDATTAGNNINTNQACPAGVAGGCPRSSAEWVAEAPSGGRGYYPLPNFTAWTLNAGTATSNLRVNQPIGAFPNDQLTLTAVNPPGQAAGTYPLAPTGALNAGGNSFITTWTGSY